MSDVESEMQKMRVGHLGLVHELSETAWTVARSRGSLADVPTDQMWENLSASTDSKFNELMRVKCFQ